MTWVFDGQKVLFFWEKRWVPCVVAQAMGDTARVVNPLMGINTWEDVINLKEMVNDHKEDVAGKEGILRAVEP